MRATKNLKMTGLLASETLQSLMEKALLLTGLSLTLESTIGINSADTVPYNILYSKVNTQRINNKNRSISAFDVMDSILTLTNSTLRQRGGKWVMYNKLDHESLSADVTFDELTIGARREIIPIASSVGVFQEHGGGALHPTNYNFASDLSGWTAYNGFNSSINNLEILGFTLVGSSLVPVYGSQTTNKYLVNQSNDDPATAVLAPYLESGAIAIPYADNQSIEIILDVNGICAPGIGTDVNRINFAVIAVKDSVTYTMNSSGGFDSDSLNVLSIAFNIPSGTGYEAFTGSRRISAVLNVEDSITDYDVYIRIYGSGTADLGVDTIINFINISFNTDVELPTGNIYKTEQGTGFTKVHELKTSIFGDRITTGLNGYFYNYLLNDTSSLLNPSGEFTSLWTATDDTATLPVLQHVSRQKARLFSKAHNFLRGELDLSSFDPLSVYEDCNGKKYVMTSALYDFFNSVVNLELEEAIIDGTILRRDFIYSSFGEDGATTVSGVGSVSGGGSGGGMTPDQLVTLNLLASFWKVDENGKLYTEFDTYSTKELSAYGAGSGGGGGFGSLALLSDVILTTPVNTNILQYNGTHWVNIDVSSIPGNASWGTFTVDYTQLTVGGVTKNVSLNGHGHSISDIAGLAAALVETDPTVPAWAKNPTKPTYTPSEVGAEPAFFKNTAFNKNFGTTSGTVAEGNHSHAYLPLAGGVMSGVLVINGRDYTPITSPSGQNLLINGPEYDPSEPITQATSPGIGFHWPDRTWASLIFDGSFKFVNNSFTGYVPVVARSIELAYSHTKSILLDVDSDGNLVIGGSVFAVGEMTAYNTGSSPTGLTISGLLSASGGLNVTGDMSVTDGTNQWSFYVSSGLLYLKRGSTIIGYFTTSGTYVAY